MSELALAQNVDPIEVVTFRPAKTPDIAWIFPSFWRSYCDYALFAEKRLLKSHAYAHAFREYCSRVCNSADITVAECKDVPELVLGWVAVREGALHYVHVRRDFQRIGICRALMAHAGVPLSVGKQLHVNETTCFRAIPQVRDWIHAPWLRMGM